MRTYASVNLDIIRENVLHLKEKLNPSTKMMGVIKADGYGHGAVPIAYALDDLCAYYGIATVDEAIELRYAGIRKPLLILAYTSPSLYQDLLKYDITQTIYDFETASKLNDVAKTNNKKAKIHLAVDTGMTRIGLCYNEPAASIECVLAIARLPYIEIEGIFSHFATVDEKDTTKAQEQAARFKAFVNVLENKGISIPIKHLSNSAGIIQMGTDWDMVRAGISMYGFYPSEEIDKNIIELTPAMTLKTHVIALKKVPKNVGISYGLTYVTKKDDEHIATLSIGYGDGYPRALSNRGRVLINGQYAPIVGRVCMDQFMVNIDGIENIELEDTVTVMGSENDKTISAEEIGSLSESFNYEVVCQINKRVPRVYIYQGKLYESVSDLPFIK